MDSHHRPGRPRRATVAAAVAIAGMCVAPAALTFVYAPDAPAEELATGTDAGARGRGADPTSSRDAGAVPTTRDAGAQQTGASHDGGARKKTHPRRHPNGGAGVGVAPLPSQRPANGGVTAPQGSSAPAPSSAPATTAGAPPATAYPRPSGSGAAPVPSIVPSQPGGLPGPAGGQNIPGPGTPGTPPVGNPGTNTGVNPGANPSNPGARPGMNPGAATPR